jgi:S1-C subfamily serine protease
MVFVLLLAAALIASAAPSSLQTEVLYTQVRVRTAEAGGSGTVIWSEKMNGFYSTYIITCHHVIDKAVTLKDKWNPLLQKDIKTETREPVFVEFFNYKAVPHGKPPLTNGVIADVVAYDPTHDMALLNVKLAERPAVAALLDAASIENVMIGDPVVAIGCALLHDPILTMGVITHMGDVIESKDYWMSSAQIIFGNSGGAMFLHKGSAYKFIGIPSRVDVIGWGSPVTHCGYFSPITRVYEFLQDQVFDFIVPGSKRTETECATDRKARREKAKS